jgi:arylsulfatase A-like enzyme
MSAFFDNYPLVLLVALVSIVSLLIILPALKGADNYVRRLKFTASITVIIGFVFGVLNGLGFIVSNKYLQYKMYYLSASSITSSINECILIALVSALVVSLVLYVFNGFLNVVHVKEESSTIVVSGIIPGLLVFIIGGYWINKLFLPDFLELKSVIGNAVWAIICVPLLLVAGSLVSSLSRRKFSFASSTYSAKSLIGLLVLIMVINLATYTCLHFIKKDRPNLIVISIDTLRADHVGAYGYDRHTTPNIDRFARDGVRFLNAIAQAPWTLPSHMSIFTGLYSSSHGVVVPTDKLSKDHLTLAEILQNAGYETVAFTDAGYLDHRYGYQGFDLFDDRSSKDGDIEKTSAKAVGWLRNTNSKPFFLFLHTYQVHCPYDPPNSYDIYSDRNYKGIIKVEGNCPRYYNEIQARMTREDYQYVIDKYDGEIYQTDHVLGKFFDELKNLKLYDNTVIVFTSDHGENFLDHPDYGIGHNELYDETVKVPLIVKAPEFPRNKAIDVQVESIDIMPTVLEILGIDMPNSIDGISLVGLIKKGDFKKVFAFSENGWKIFNQKEGRLTGLNYKMIRSNNEWKLIRSLNNDMETFELFDLKSDPDEMNNLLTRRPEVARPLYESLNVWMDNQEEKSKLFSTSEVRMDDKLSEQLKALGYVN